MSTQKIKNYEEFRVNRENVLKILDYFQEMKRKNSPVDLRDIDIESIIDFIMEYNFLESFDMLKDIFVNQDNWSADELQHLLVKHGVNIDELPEQET